MPRTDPRLIPVAESNTVWNGVTTSRDGRVFVNFPHEEGGPGVKIAELTADGGERAYPNPGWNAWTPGKDASNAFVRTNGLRIGPDGKLWIIDTGAPGFKGSVVAGGAKLVVIDLGTNRVERTISLAGAVKDKSYIDDIRFNGNYIYITDAGEPALIVLDRDTGILRRVLEDDKSTTAGRPIFAEGKKMVDLDGKDAKFHADQLEVSPDGALLYFQPASGPIYQIETKWLNDATEPASDLSKHVRQFVDVPATGGTAIDASGTIYYSDPDRSRILTLTPDGKLNTLIEDSRLIWPDAMWIDDEGFLWIPVPQMNRTEPFNKGKSKVDFPVHIYKMKIGAKPAPNDHGAMSMRPTVP